MSQNLFLRFFFYLFFWNIYHSFAKVSELSIFKLGSEESALANISVAKYNSSAADLTLRLNEKPNQEKCPVFLIELNPRAENKLRRSSPVNFGPKFECGRRSYLVSFLPNSETNATVVTIDHVYTGNYELKISCCADLRKYSCSSSRQDVKEISVETSLPDLDMRKINSTIRLTKQERGVKIDFLFDYANNSPKFLKFNQFDVLVEASKAKRRLSKIVNSTEALFEDFNDVFRLSNLTVDNFTVTVSPLDSRCNNPQNCDSIDKPCKRYVTYKIFPVLDTTTGVPSVLDVQINSSVNYIWIPLLFVTISVLLASLFYKFRFSVRNLPLSETLASPLNLSTLQPNSINAIKVLLVYDMNDKFMERRAAKLRHQLIIHGVHTVYDFCDTDQEENINTRGRANWFNGLFHDCQIQIIVIQSSETNRSLQELMQIDGLFGQNSIDATDTFLLYVLNELIGVVSASQSNRYHRIFVTAYSDMELESHHSLLTPFRCFILPDHFAELLSQLHYTTTCRIELN